MSTRINIAYADKYTNGTTEEPARENPNVSIVIDFLIYGYLFRPILEALNARGLHVRLFCPKEIVNQIQAMCADLQAITISDLSVVKLRHRMRWRIHRCLGLLFTRSDFSFQFMRRRQHVDLNRTGWQRALLRLARFTPKVPNRKINSFLHKVVGWRMSSPFGTTKVIVGSLNASAELLCAGDMDVYTVMESWDHAVKNPNGYISKIVFVWNNALGEDWANTQGDRRWRTVYPLKLRYAIEEIGRKRLSMGEHVVDVDNRKPLCVYAVAASRRFARGPVVGIERRIIRDLCTATEAAGWRLHLKPWPNGSDGEFDEFSSEFANVTVGKVNRSDSMSAANYTLDDEYNKNRFREIDEAGVIINAFTTFGLDAAVAGYPVLQLDLRNAVGYEDTRQLYSYHHIEKYLLGREHVLRVNGISLVDAMAQFLSQPGQLAECYSEELRQWLIPRQSIRESVDAMLDEIFAGS